MKDLTPTILPPAIIFPTPARTVIFTWGPLEYPLWGTSSVCAAGCGFPCPGPWVLEGNLPELSRPESAGGSKHCQILTVTHSGHRVLYDGQVREPPLSRGDPGDCRHGGHCCIRYLNSKIKQFTGHFTCCLHATVLNVGL